jgi:hypothetical protein
MKKNISEEGKRVEGRRTRFMKKNYSLGSILCFVAVIWSALLYPTAQYSSEVLSKYGFGQVNIANQLFGILVLFVIGLLVMRLFVRAKLELNINQAIALAGASFGLIGFLISIHETAILLLLILAIPSCFIVRNYVKSLGNTSLILAALAIYMIFSLIFFLEFRIFFDAKESLLSGVILSSSFVTGSFVIISNGFFIIEAFGKNLGNNKRDLIFIQSLGVCSTMPCALKSLLHGTKCPEVVLLTAYTMLILLLVKCLKTNPNNKNEEARNDH